MPATKKSGNAADVWEPVEAWQIVSVQRIEASESRQWGEGGEQVLAWFDLGEAKMALDWEAAHRGGVVESAPGLVDRIAAWFRGQGTLVFSRG